MSASKKEIINSYPKIWNFGHRAIYNILESELIIEEKVDGSQLSAQVINGELIMRSKGQQLILDNPDKMFLKAVDVFEGIKDAMTPEYVYRGEYLQSPSHNAIQYERIPKNHFIVFDIETKAGTERYLTYEEKVEEATRLGFETVPLFFKGKVTALDFFEQFLERDSILGGSKVEGMVIKNYNKFGEDGKILLAKFVRVDFRELKESAQKKNYPAKKDVLEILKDKYRSEARWFKAIQHLKEKGVEVEDPSVIGALIKEVQRDILEEETDTIKEDLFHYFHKDILRASTSGLPEWFKDKLKNDFGTRWNNMMDKLGAEKGTVKDMLSI